MESKEAHKKKRKENINSRVTDSDEARMYLQYTSHG